MHYVDVWPYEMTDSSNESAGCKIPAIIVSKDHGERMLRYLQAIDNNCEAETAPFHATDKGIASAPQALQVTIVCRKVTSCVICHEDFHTGTEALQMPCQHIFHSACLLHWLKIRNSCPVCRYELDTGDALYEERRRTRHALNAMNSRLWDSWYT